MQRQEFRSGPLKRLFAQAVRVGDAIHIAGQVAMDEHGEIVSREDLLGQVRQVYRNVEAVLAQVGARPQHLVSETWYVVDMADFIRNGAEISGLRRDVYGGDPPVAQTVVEVRALFRPEVLVEIQFVAHL